MESKEYKRLILKNCESKELMLPNYVSGNIRNHISVNFEYKEDAI